MSKPRRTESSVVVVCLGSPHGDDRAGWQLATMLQARPKATAHVISVTEAIELVEELAGCRRLIIVDACRSGGEIGRVSRLRWPDRRLAERSSHSTHGLGLCDALRLAEQLGQLPPDVEIFGIEIADCSQGNEISPAVLQAVVDLEAVIFHETRGVLHA